MTPLIQSGLGIWLATVVFSMVLLQFHVARPGTVAAVDPVQVVKIRQHLGVEKRERLILVFVNPKCPCSAATLNNVKRLMVRKPVDLRFVFIGVFCKDPLLTKDFFDTSNEKSHVVSDPMGHFSEKLGVTTSGHVLMLDEVDQLLFSGGITAGRGHRGNSESLEQLVKLIDRSGSKSLQTDGPAVFPVWGCDFGFSKISTSPEPTDAN